MTIEIKLGAALDEGQEVSIIELACNAGDAVNAGDVLIAYETDKATVELTAERAGTVVEVMVNVGELVSANTILALLDDKQTQSLDSTLVNISLGTALQEGLVVTIGEVTTQLGGLVKQGDTLFAYETDKTTVEFTSPTTGTVQNIYSNVGDSISSETIVLTISETLSEKNGIESPQSQERMSEELEADITIIGGGPGGYVAAIKAVQLGQKVVVVEKESLGGTCLNWGCIPTKALVRSAEVLDTLKHAEDFGIVADNVGFNFDQVMGRKNKVVKQLVDGVGFLLSKNSVTTVKGSATISSSEVVTVSSESIETTIRSKNIIIATGSESANLPIPGSDLECVIDSKQALALSELPEKIVIVGGGVIGMEFAFIFASFGVDVSVVEYAESTLINCDIDVIDEVEKAAEEKGIKLYTGAKVEEIINTEGTGSLVAFTQEGSKKYLATDKVLMAVGRVPNLTGIDADALGLELNANGRGIAVNERMETNVPNVYAIGDVTNIIQLAHVASHQGIVAVNNIAGIDAEMDYKAVPSAIFTHPEIGMVGMTEQQVIKKGLEYVVGKFPFVANGKALALGESKGFIKIIADKATDKILGASIVGPNATDMIAELTLAMRNELTTEQIIETIHAHPTTAEVVHEASLAFHGGSIHF
ncbi:dihydrolipoyl dehydrogenase [Vibrio sp. 1CM24A]|uniref:dihydrolipoyl dehydrogenase n=1 Tax=Vibrio sp. 1CM24A TaxID=2929165 RepID=UPI0020C05BC7|nr:dihydrolipoyl dehydrogenase [Vibrio sp. 1CM24A]MCK8083659.1 dihydrolipoyl dehydrogenase [Vibrio sp. 1CM24A]